MPLYCAVAIGGHCNSHEKNVPRVSVQNQRRAGRSAPCILAKLGRRTLPTVARSNTPNSRAQQTPGELASSLRSLLAARRSLLTF